MVLLIVNSLALFMAIWVEEGSPYQHVAIMPLEKLFQSYLHTLDLKPKKLNDEQIKIYVDRCFNSYLFLMSGFIIIVLQNKYIVSHVK